jgi:hypothetical protein
MKCPRCGESIDYLNANYTQTGYCKVYPDGTDDHNPDNTDLCDHTCPKCEGAITNEEASDLTE